MADREQIKSIAILVAGSCALAFVVYNVLQTFREDGIYSLKLRKKKKKDKVEDKGGELVHLLETLDKTEVVEKANLMYAITKLIDRAAFTEVQVKIKELGYLPKIMRTLQSGDDDVKKQVALLINNLSLNVENQAVLKECIPALVNILKAQQVSQTTVTLFTAVLQGLTNLTTLNESHNSILPYISTLCELLQQCDVVQIKLQVLKILVNISTNEPLCENQLELDAQLLRSVENYISQDVDEKFLLRAVSCCANVLTSLHRRWELGQKASVATPEFVSQKLYENLIMLTAHSNEDIRLQTNRALLALRQPSSNDNSYRSMANVDKVDILDVLKI